MLPEAYKQTLKIKIQNTCLNKDSVSMLVSYLQEQYPYFKVLIFEHVLFFILLEFVETAYTLK